MFLRPITLIVIFISLILFGCQKDGNALRERSKHEIVETEKEFEAMGEKKGLAEAFSYYAADSAVLRRRESLCIGKENIRKNYESLAYKEISLKWSPDFVDASRSGDLGYTYGKYTFSAKDSSGKVIEDKGYFHTVWKKQPDGKWKFVWD
jgi:ketosteroid isomerase-like protein